MTKFAFISEGQDSLAYQCRLISEGHEVKTYVKLPEFQKSGEGIIDIVKTWEQLIPWADYFYVDSNCFGKISNVLRTLKKKVFGGTLDTDKTETVRSFGFELLEEYGIDCGVWEGPFDAAGAISHIKKDPKRWCIKPDGSMDKDLTYVSKDAEDALDFLTEHKSQYKGKLILQEFVDDAKELALGVTVQAGQILYPVRENVEHKNLCNGNLGVSTGEMGTIVHYTYSSPLLDIVEQLAPWFEKENLTGDFDLNFMIKENGEAICLETTARPGYPISILQCDNIDGDFGDYLIDLIEGNLSEIPMKELWTCGVVLTAPGFPFKESFLKHGIDRHIEQVTEIYEEGLYLYDMSKDEKGFKTSGYNGTTLVAVASADKLDTCIEECYNKIKSYDFPRWLSYRTDIGKDLVNEDLKWFQERGYLND